MTCSLWVISKTSIQLCGIDMALFVNAGKQTWEMNYVQYILFIFLLW